MRLPYIRVMSAQYCWRKAHHFGFGYWRRQYLIAAGRDGWSVGLGPITVYYAL